MKEKTQLIKIDNYSSNKNNQFFSNSSNDHFPRMIFPEIPIHGRLLSAFVRTRQWFHLYMEQLQQFIRIRLHNNFSI